jgi:Ca2+/H+ antiporter
MAFTAEMLVESIEYVREAGNIGEEWFGLVLLPIVSFAADGTGTSYSLIYQVSLRALAALSLSRSLTSS